MSNTTIQPHFFGFDGDRGCRKPVNKTVVIRYLDNQTMDRVAVRRMIDSKNFFSPSQYLTQSAVVAPIASITSFFDSYTTPYKIVAGRN